MTQGSAHEFKGSCTPADSERARNSRAKALLPVEEAPFSHEPGPDGVLGAAAPPPRGIGIALADEQRRAGLLKSDHKDVESVFIELADWIQLAAARKHTLVGFCY